MKALVWRRNPDGIGLDIGWRFDHDETVLWGNVRDEAHLEKIAADLRAAGNEFADGGEIQTGWDVLE